MRLATNPVKQEQPPELRSLHELYTAAQMQAVLRRERARTDRSGREFSLVLFQADLREHPQSGALRLAHIIQTRVRETDDVGRFDQQQLCALLPETSAAGAWRFAQSVCDSAKHHGLKPACVVYTYPSDWFGDRDDQSASRRLRRQRDLADRSGEDKDNHDGNGHNGNGDGRKLVPHFMKGLEQGLREDTTTREETQAVRPLEHLLVRPIPVWKRTLDVIGSSTAILIFGPFMLMAALAIKLGSRGPVIFKQQRAGLGGKPFTIYKFRTMAVDAESRKHELKSLSEQDGPAFKIRHDPRITRVGRFLRKTSLDELPQFFNVLKGDMSLVGPRPLPVEESEDCDLWHRCRLEVTPGITCIWQIKGRSQVTFDEWVRMDINYIRRRKLKNDLAILVQTIPAVLLRRGAH